MEVQLGRILTEQEASPLVGLKDSTLQTLRVNGGGPRYCKLGRSVRYREEDLEEWLSARLVGSTSEPVPA
jgi:excisionase family DNA binding protein